MAPRRKPPLAALMASPDDDRGAVLRGAARPPIIERLMALWSVHDEFVRCIHPGGRCIVGHHRGASASFEAIFAQRRRWPCNRPEGQWLPGGHAQTIWPPWCAAPPGPRRQR
jgi:hypothetical protein